MHLELWNFSPLNRKSLLTNYMTKIAKCLEKDMHTHTHLPDKLNSLDFKNAIWYLVTSVSPSIFIHLNHLIKNYILIVIELIILFLAKQWDVLIYTYIEFWIYCLFYYLHFWLTCTKVDLIAFASQNVIHIQSLAIVNDFLRLASSKENV